MVPSAQNTSQRFRFQTESLVFYRYYVIRKVAMCQYHHYLAGARVIVKLASRAGTSGQLFELAITAN
jgi:hypothetical protein